MEEKKDVLKEEASQAPSKQELSFSDLVKMVSKLKEDPIVKFLSAKRKILCAVIMLLGVLCAGLLFRVNTFWLPHWVGDQSHYISLAMKIEKLGFNYYNLYGLNVDFIDLDKEKRFRIVYPVLDPDLNSKGLILKGMETVGIMYYTQPLFHKPPALAYALILSHKLFSKNKDLYTVVFTNIAPVLNKVKPKVFFDAQFYAVIIPLFFSLGLMVTAFFIGKMLFSYRAGLYAALLLAINPVSIMTAQKVWADDMVAFFVVLAVLLCLIARRYKLPWIMFLAGVSCGVGVLAKQSGGYIIPGLIIFMVLDNKDSVFNWKKTLNVIFSKEILLFLGGVFLVSGFWFLKVYQVFGNPLYLPNQANIYDKDLSGWFRELAKRPSGVILYSVYIPVFCPLFALMYFSLKKFFINLMKAIAKKEHDYRFVFLWLITFSFLYFVRGEKEERLMLPMYPVLAVLAAYSLDALRQWIAKSKNKLINKPLVGDAVILALFIICAVYSVPIGIETGLNQTILMKLPF